MAKELVTQFNWVDVFVFFVFLRIVLIALRQGFAIEFFKLSGTLLALFVSYHYYSDIAEFVSSHSLLPLDFSSFFCFAFLMALILGIIKFSRDGFLVLIKIQPSPILDKWGSVILGIVRATFLSSIIISMMFISTIDYLQKSVQRSLSSGYLLDFAPKTYAFIFDNIFSKFSPKEEVNLAIFKAIEKKE